MTPHLTRVAGILRLWYLLPHSDSVLDKVPELRLGSWITEAGRAGRLDRSSAICTDQQVEVVRADDYYLPVWTFCIRTRGQRRSTESDTSAYSLTLPYSNNRVGEGLWPSLVLESGFCAALCWAASSPASAHEPGPALNPMHPRPPLSAIHRHRCEVTFVWTCCEGDQFVC